ncbi:hypothetical protein HDV63DRAFT_379334, partial [Trichoderma sp. SZMC 28014]
MSVCDSVSPPLAGKRITWVVYNCVYGQLILLYDYIVTRRHPFDSSAQYSPFCILGGLFLIIAIIPCST